MEYTVTGIITAICDESGVVSFAIDGAPKSFGFSKRIFYTFGMPCEGSMANILDEGMEVQLSFDTRPDRKPRVIAVWLGNPPDAACLRNKVVDSDTLYDRKGCVSGFIGNENFLIQADGFKVLASKQAMYQDGGLVTAVARDAEIRFDAIPLEERHPSGALYEATCAWTGKAPRLVDRFCLDSGEDPLEEDMACLDNHELYGTVVVIPNDVVALVEVEFNAVVFEVMLFRNSFDMNCDRIQDVVDVGDGVFVRIKSNFIFDDCRQWIAVRAWRSEFELCDDADEVQTSVPNSVGMAMTTVQILQMIVVGWVLSVAKFVVLLYNRVGMLPVPTIDQRKVTLNIVEPSAGRANAEVVPIQEEVGLKAQPGDVIFPEADSGEEVGLLEESAEEVLSKACLDDTLGSESVELEILFPEVGPGDNAESDATLAEEVPCEVGLRLEEMSMAEESGGEVSSSEQGVSLSTESSEAELSEVFSRQHELLEDPFEEVSPEISSDQEEISLGVESL